MENNLNNEVIVHTIPIDKIKVNDRFRKEFVDIESLAIDIEKRGLIHPINIDENFNLITGERRYRAHKFLGKDTIQCIIRKGMSELQQKEMELSENIERNDFTWEEKVVALQTIHILMQQLYGKAVQGHESSGWKLEDTANKLGKSIGSISMDITLAEHLVEYPELRKETNKTNARKKLIQILKKKEKTKIAEFKIKTGLSSPNLILGDCITEMGKMQSETIDLCITDPPYGINFDKSCLNTENRREDIYEDIPHEIENLVDLSCREIYRLLKPNSHLYMFYPTNKYEWMLNSLEQAGFDVFPLPLIWVKESASYPSQLIFPASDYETFLFARKGNDRKLNKPITCCFNVHRVTANLKIHPAERPIQLIRPLIEASSNVGDTVFDPFAGSGVTLQAALELNRNAIGIEKNIMYYNATTERLNKICKINTVKTDKCRDCNQEITDIQIGSRLPNGDIICINCINKNKLGSE